MCRAITGFSDEERLKKFIEEIIDYIQGNQEYMGLVNVNTYVELDNYKEKKMWNSDAIDLLPRFISDFLRTSILVINCNQELIHCTTFGKDYEIRKVVLLKDQHYWRTEYIIDIANERDKRDYCKPTLVLPYINGKVNSEIKQVVKLADLDCNVVFRSKKLYDLTKSQTKAMTIEDIREEQGVVYQLKCQECELQGNNVIYIGETGRKLKTRLGEHFAKLSNRTRLSEVGRHDLDKHDSFNKKRWEVLILNREKDEFKRKAKETAYIHAFKPALNISQGIFILGIEDIKI